MGWCSGQTNHAKQSPAKQNPNHSALLRSKLKSSRLAGAPQILLQKCWQPASRRR
jgi:hypothetical protein